MSKNRTRTYPHVDVTICLDAALAAEREGLLAQRGPVAAKQLKALEESMRDSLLTVRVMGVPRGEYMKIQRAHPGQTPLQAFNPDTFFYDVIYKTGFEVEADGTLTRLADWKRSEWDEITDGLTEGEWNDLAQAVHNVNVNRVETGFLSRGSAQTEPSTPTSEQPEPGE